MSIFGLSALGYASIACVTAGLVGLIVTHVRRRKIVRFEESFTPISAWKPTGNIDFVSCRAPKTDDNDESIEFGFMLRAEDYRTLESLSISGSKRLEFRWRNAGLDEAKQVVVRHNFGRKSIEHFLPSLMSGPRIVPDSGPDVGERSTLELSANLPAAKLPEN